MSVILWNLTVAFFILVALFALLKLTHEMRADEVKSDVLPAIPAGNLEPIAHIRRCLGHLQHSDGIDLALFICEPGSPWSDRDYFQDADPIPAKVSDAVLALSIHYPDQPRSLLIESLQGFPVLVDFMHERGFHALYLAPMGMQDSLRSWLLFASKKPADTHLISLENAVRILTSDLGYLRYHHEMHFLKLQSEEAHSRSILQRLDEQRSRESHEQALEQALLKVEDAKRVKNEFLASVSHELRTPLNAIQGYTRIVQREENLSNRQRLSLDRVLESSQNLLRLINNILDYSRLEAGGVRLTLEMVDLTDLIAGIVRQLESLAQEKDLELSFTRDKQDDGMVLPSISTVTDRMHLERVLINLVGNAIKFTRQGHVRLSLRQVAGTLILEVTDSGIGISKAEAERVFGRFQQGEQAAEHPQGGTGLGLAISRRLTELLGGRIELSSEPGQGCTFTIRLPLFLDLMTAKQVLQSDEDTYSSMEIL
jgi:signal transduction histidine kinase